jgi:hypothetical protein
MAGRKRKVILIVSAASALALIAGFLMNLRIAEVQANRMLMGVVGETGSDFEVVATGRHAKILFGGSDYAWQVRSQGPFKLPPAAQPSDESDLAFARDAIAELLRKPAAKLKPISVHRMSAGRQNFYILLEENSKDVYVYMILH